MKKIKLAPVLLLLLLSGSCQNHPNKNSSEELLIREAIQVSNLFLTLICKKQFDSCLSLTKGITITDISVGTKYSDSTLGGIKNFNYKKTELNYVIGTNGKDMIIRTYYDLKRFRKNCYRIFYLEFDSTMKIVGYEDKFNVE